MPLARGDRLGPYEIIAPLGAGGMGEVYRACDTKLKRDVALKILPDVFSTDAERLARFEREAQVLASVSHANIGHIYGIEDSGSTPALVLELIPGPTLAELIARAPLQLADALHIAIQIARAVEAAHERGIVHRDLKPANIKVQPDGVVKVLDFGLAKALDPVSPPDADWMKEPTLTGPADMTLPGVVLGTAAYMSPEQARGLDVDKRSDIWAFGCVLFEMISGRVAFSGATISDAIAGILTREPDWSALPEATPLGVRVLLQRCLDKDARNRLRDIGDARLELESFECSTGEMPAQLQRAKRTEAVERAPTATRRSRSLYLAAALALVIGLPLAGILLFTTQQRVAPPPSPTEYTQITNFTDSATAPSLSPDGRMVTFIRGGEAFLSNGQVYVKLLPNGESLQLTTGSHQKHGPVFTPDGSRVAYTELVDKTNSWDTWTVPVLGGPPRLLLPNASGLTWVGERDVLFAEIKGVGFHMGLVTATETRAQSREIYMPPHESAMAHYAYASPDRRWILVVEMDRTHTFNQPCRLLPFDGSSMGRQVGPQGFCTAAAWSPDGQWMYFGATVGRGSHLWRQRFPDGAPEQVTSGPSEEEGIAIAPDGRSLVTSIGTRRSAVWIHDAAGNRALSSEGFAGAPQMSSDGKRVFYLFLRDLSSTTTELRSIDLATGRVESLLPGVSVGDYDISRDGKEVAFSVTEANGQSNVWLASLDRRAAPRQVAQGADQVSFGADGDLVFRSLDERTNVLGRVRTDGSGRERLAAAGAILDKYGVSPDGQWVIVQSSGDEKAEPAMIAAPLHDGQPVKLCALCQATWSEDGKFFYVAIERSAAWSPRASWALSGSSDGKTLAIPVPPGRSLPEMPADGIDPSASGADVKGAGLIPHGDLARPGSLDLRIRQD